MKHGTWTTTCESDSRLNLSGRASNVFTALELISGALSRRALEIGYSFERLASLPIDYSFLFDRDAPAIAAAE